MPSDGMFGGIGKWLFGDPKQDRERGIGRTLSQDPYGHMDTLEMLRQRAMQQDPTQTVSGQLLQQALGQNVAAQHSMAAGAPAAQQAMARRMAMQQAGQLGMQTAQKQALAAIMERERAEQALAGMQSGLRGQDLGLWAKHYGMQEPTPGERLMGGLAGMGQLYATYKKAQQPGGEQ